MIVSQFSKRLNHSIIFLLRSPDMIWQKIMAVTIVKINDDFNNEYVDG